MYLDMFGKLATLGHGRAYWPISTPLGPYRPYGACGTLAMVLGSTSSMEVGI